MDPQVSAFAVYHQQNKKKRKSPTENQKELVVNNTAKKLKKGSPSQTKVESKPILSNKNLKKNNVKVSKVKKTKLTYLNSPVKDQDSSEDEIPTLVPIMSPQVQKPKHINGVQNNNKKVISKIKSSKNVTNGKQSDIRIKSNLKPAKNNDPPSSYDNPAFNPVIQGLAIFKWFIDPITPKEFFEKYWEKEVLHVKRSDRSYFKDVFSSEKLDHIMREHSLHFTRNIDVVVYQNGKKEVMDEEGRALPCKVWDFYNNGCSVRILNPQTYDQNVHSIISSLQEYFGTMVGTNAYLTPPDSQGFAPHFDDIEAFIVQLEGSKYWKLYKPKQEDVLARDSSHNFKAEELGDPFMEVKLNAGDLLYFPRGTIHEGHTKSDEHSLHITVSMYQHTAYIDLLEHALPAALKKAANEDIEFRRGLPLNYLKHLGEVNKNDKSNKRALIINKIKSLMSSLINYLDVDSAADILGRKFMHDAMPPLYSIEEAQSSSKLDGDFMKNGKVLNRVEIGPEVRIRLLRYYVLRLVRESETTSKLYFCTDNAKTYHGEDEQWLEINNLMIPGVEMLQKKYPEFIAADSVPIEDETEKLSLISSLWEHGLLVTDGPLPSCDSNSDSGSSSSDNVYELLEEHSD